MVVDLKVFSVQKDKNMTLVADLKWMNSTESITDFQYLQQKKKYAFVILEKRAVSGMIKGLSGAIKAFEIGKEEFLLEDWMPLNT